MQKTRKKPFQNYKSIQVDFHNKKSRKAFADYLGYSWGVNNKTISKVFSKHSGRIRRYSPEHAVLMYELINEHFDGLSKEERLGYITSKKITFAYFNDSSALEFFITFFASIFVSAVISSTSANITFWDKFCIVVASMLLAIMVVFIKAALKPKFYYEIITTIENNMKD